MAGLLKAQGSRMRRFLLLGCVFLLAAQAACKHGPAVVFEGSEGIKAAFRVEVADTAEKRRWGLMYRRELGTDEACCSCFPTRRFSRSG